MSSRVAYGYRVSQFHPFAPRASSASSSGFVGWNHCPKNQHNAHIQQHSPHTTIPLIDELPPTQRCTSHQPPLHNTHPVKTTRTPLSIFQLSAVPFSASASSGPSVSVERAIAAAGKGGRTFPIALLGRDVVAVGGDVDGLDAARVGSGFDDEDG